MDYLANITHQDLQLSKLPIVVNVDASSPVTYPVRTNLRYYLELFVPEFYQGSFISLTTLEGSEEPPQTLAGVTAYPGANFEIQDLLHGLVESCVPEFGLNEITLCETMVRPYYAKAIRKNGSVLIDEIILPSGFVYRGGFLESDYAAYKNKFFTSYVGSGRRFLTWKPNHATLRPDQPEYLGFITNFSPTPSELRLRVEITYEDWSTETITAKTLSEVSSMAVYVCPVGPTQLNLQARMNSAGEFVIRYKVWLSNENNERLSEERTYLVDRQPFRKVRYILFQNSLGLFDTLDCYGDGFETLRVQRQTAEQFRGYEYLPRVSERVINRVTGERELTVAVGYGRYQIKDLRDYWQDLFFAEQMYLVTDREHIPLTLLSDSYLADDDREKTVGRTLTFRYTNKETSYSRLPALIATPERPTGWRGDAQACELDQSTGLRNGKKRYGLLVKYYIDSGEDVKPRTQKPNIVGTEGYIPSWDSVDCTAGTTPFKNVLISQTSVYKRNNCAVGQVGGNWTVSVAANTYGSEVSQTDADGKAQAAANALDTQENANMFGTCIVPAPIPIGLTSACPTASTQPIFAVIVGSEEIITNTSFNSPTVRYAATGLNQGSYNLDIRVQYAASPFESFRIRIPSKGFSSAVLAGNQTYRIANISINWGDADLVIICEPA
ncbi:DUF5977 domain-containing protein [Runella slithyformis]|uniref:DUF5977 domain-containing protein n=1 Tax=Runella slithyformis (strain ATCC 29530 / DSM 19594 / LMG 11500 / NCIMB 11436 / LSU 4) TaxID=761193 RepID=A0A7U3ZGL1_RUNSL|nr:DUF5977 domain-containing protein [Runella slithyformis]AEI46805.1 hypothetical protein Runsl_0353 [Runella slithyformis DSM 19594]